MKQNKAYTIGITGGVGSGKSLALEYLKDKYNCYIIKADDIGNEVKFKGNACYEPIVKLLGEDILGEDGEIIKNKMAEKIFSDKDLIEKVNGIIHPAVREEIVKRIKDNSNEYKIFVIEAALLVEANYFDDLNELWEVFAEKDIRIERLMKQRNYSLEKCENIIGSQHDTLYYVVADEEYQKSSNRDDYYGFKMIFNNSSEEELFMQIDIAMEEINERIG